MFHIVYNPFANRGGSLLYFQAFIELLESEGRNYKTYPTDHPGHATELTQQIIADGGKHIIALGGDGTVHEVINGYSAGDDVVFGILPAGTGNDVATTLGLPPEPKNVRIAAKAILEGKVKAIDYMENSNGEKSVLFFSYGIAAQMILAMEGFATKTKSSYVRSIFQKVLGHKSATYQYSIDGGELITVEADFLGMHNCIYGGGGMTLIKDAVVDDGYSEVFIVEHRGMARRLRNLTALMAKKIHKQANVKIVKAKKLSIYSNNDNLCCSDGEILHLNKLELRVVSGELKIFGE